MGSAASRVAGLTAMVGVRSLPEREKFPVMTATATFSPDMTMHDLLEAMPGARRALFAKYHIGGCSSCGFSPAETVAEVCRRNENIDPAEMIAHLEASAEQDALMQVSPE